MLPEELLNAPVSVQEPVFKVSAALVQPSVRAYGKDFPLKPGMTFALEPMINMGTAAVQVMENGWTALTCDGKPSAHFEHTVLVTPNGHEIIV